NSAQQFRCERRFPWPIQCHLIFFVDLVTWVGKPLRQVAIICQKQQTFSLRVQTSDVEEARKFLWKQIKDSVARVRIFSGLNKSRGLVQHVGKGGSGANKFAVDLHVAVCASLCA